MRSLDWLVKEIYRQPVVFGLGLFRGQRRVKKVLTHGDPKYLAHPVAQIDLKSIVIQHCRFQVRREYILIIS